MRWIEAVNGTHKRWNGKRWRWYYIEADEKIYRVRSPFVLFALWLGWRPKPSLPHAVVARRSTY